MKNIINNCSNNNQINNTMEVKTMKQQINIATINKYTNSNDVSVIASAVNYGFLFNTNTDIEQISAYLLLCEANSFEAPDNGIEGLARLSQIYFNTIEYRDFAGIGTVSELNEYEEVNEKVEVTLTGWRIENFIDSDGVEYRVTPMSDEQLESVRTYAETYNEMQPANIRVSLEDIDSIIEDYRYNRRNFIYDDEFATDIKQCVRKDAAREFDPAALIDEPFAVVISYPYDGRTESRYDPNDLCFMVGDLLDYNRLNAFLLVCKLNGFHAPGCDDDGFARLAQVYCNTAPDKFGCVGVEKCGYYLNPECYEEAYHFELKGWDINCYISEFGEVLPIKRLTNEDYDQIAAYAKQISSKQPEALRISDDQIDAYIANAKCDDDEFATDIKQSVRKDALREFKPGQMITEPRAVVVSYPCCERDHVEYNPDDLGFVFDDDLDYNRLNAFLLVCKLNGFNAPSNGGNGFARLAQVYYNTVPAKTLDVSSIDLCGCILNPDLYEESYHFELNGWDIGCYIADSGEVLPIKALTADDYDQIGEYAKQINALQPERIRLSDDQIDAYIANAKLEG